VGIVTLVHGSKMKTSEHKKAATATPPLGGIWKLLETRGWLAERSRDVRARLLGIAQARTYQPGEPIFSTGEEPRGVYGIARGAVDISIPREDGQEIVVHQGQPGFWVGDLALFSSQRRLVTITAATKVDAAMLATGQLHRLLEQYPDLLMDFYMLSHRNVATTLQLVANLSMPRAEARVALRLLIYDQRHSTSEEWVHLSQEKLAQLTALSLPTVQRALRRFAEQGAVELSYGRLRILDRQKLLGFCG
jgi:CRP-like cAMP-binding protein